MKRFGALAVLAVLLLSIAQTADADSGNTLPDDGSQWRFTIAFP